MEVQKYSGNKSIALIRKESGERNAVHVIIEALVWARSQMNVSRNMNEEQIVTCAGIIMKEYYWLSGQDIMKCMKGGVTGKYGDVYERFDINVILGWLVRYENDRVSDVEVKRRTYDVDYPKLKALAQLKILEKKKKRYISIEEWCIEKGFKYSDIEAKIEAHQNSRLDVLGIYKTLYIERIVLAAINEFSFEKLVEVEKIIEVI